MNSLQHLESDVTAAFHDLTMVVLGQSDPPSSAEAFAGEISHVALWNRPLPRKEIVIISSCGKEYYNKMGEAVEPLKWNEGNIYYMD